MLLANLIVDLALADLRELEEVQALAAYADDVVVLTPVLPKAGESITRSTSKDSQILDREDGQLLTPMAKAHAVLTINLEKSASSYSRSVGRSDDAEDEDDEEEDVREG